LPKLAVVSVNIIPRDPTVATAFRLEIHDVIWQCLVDEAGAPRAGGSLGPADAARLAEWASNCDHPEGQRAALAWAVACLVKLGPCAVTSSAGSALGTAPVPEPERQPEASAPSERMPPAWRRLRMFRSSRPEDTAGDETSLTGTSS
jgi:hypothetical protein